MSTSSTVSSNWRGACGSSPEVVDLGVGETGRRLVQEQQLGTGGHRPSQLDALERAVRQADGGTKGERIQAERRQDVHRILRQTPLLPADPMRKERWRS